MHEKSKAAAMPPHSKVRRPLLECGANGPALTSARWAVAKRIFALMAALMAAGCSGKAGTKDSLEQNQPTPQAGMIDDLRKYPQDCLAYIPAGQGDTPLVDAARQKEMLAALRREFFAPWHAQADSKAMVLKECLRFDRPLYGPDRLPRRAGWAKAIIVAADLDQYPNRVGRAITLRNTDLRELPTRRPAFEDFSKPGEGYPFDTLQGSALWAGLPVLVTHVTKDQWAYVQTPLGSGWTPAADVGFVGDDLAVQLESAELAAVVADDTAVTDERGVPLLTTHIGAIFPLRTTGIPPVAKKTEGTDTGETPVVHREAAVWAPVPGPAGSAVRVPARVAAAKIRPLPMTMTPAALAGIANQMLGKSYGWGGLYEDRDCSSTLHDLFVPFGLWLPRNSGPQAKAGLVVPLGQIAAEEREQAILSRGVPWLTIVHLPGHVMLYLGQRDGRAVVLQSFWGVMIRQGDGREGRHIIGRCAITSLQPGLELPNILLPRGDARTRIDSMTLLAVPAGGKP